MVFNSISFIIFFCLFFLLFWLINNRFSVKARNLFTIISSYIFYGWWDWRFLSLIFISSAADFFIGMALSNSSKKRTRKALLYSSLTINLGILFFFKYFNFFTDSLQHLLEVINIPFNPLTLNIILPVGISFYTFQTLSYTIDIYKGTMKPTKDIIAFFAFVSFFPQLVAGPIERANNLLGQFFEKKHFSHHHSVEGLRLVLWGFFKKIVIADNLGILSDNIFGTTGQINGITAIAGALFFGFQIYADFSGYSDIAIGISRMMGFNLKTNFNTPYFASSFTEFWRRWHISLSTWFRDYVYIPLGGNRCPSYRASGNILITFVLSGLWHGANYTFLIWGFIHGIVLVIEKNFPRLRKSTVYSALSILLVFLLWIPFRANDFQQLSDFVSAIITPKNYSFKQLAGMISNYSSLRFLAVAIILSLFLVMESRLKTMNFFEFLNTKNKSYRLIAYYIILIAIILLGNFSVKPSFIYFQF
ncbi:MAG: membrane-bound O-acyltransferase family protein [Marinilabiliales bacterium]|nr:MAG: membrane-bound O-acyltransferase family protein [Marinilabiliales bacterium]